MKYVSIDIETTGLDPDTCQLIELGAVIDDMETSLADLPTFRYRVKAKTYAGEPYALSLHSKFFTDVAELSPTLGFEYCRTPHCDIIGPSHRLIPRLSYWLKTHEVYHNFQVAGKNFANFDARFIRRLYNAESLKWYHGILDPGSMWMRKEDSCVPTTATCIERADIQKIPGKPHTAIHDALVVCALVRKGLDR